MDEEPIQKGWLTVKQASEKYGYSRNYLRVLVKLTKIKGVEVDGIIFISEDSLRTYKEHAGRRKGKRHP